MVRSATALAAVMILAGFTPVQQVAAQTEQAATQTQQVATHTVVPGDCLWNLAKTYYGSPWEWRRIWNANKSQISDPNLIFPGWILTIPGKEAEVQKVTVQPAGEAPPPEKPAPLPSVSEPSMAHQPTVFREKQPGTGGAGASAVAAHFAVTRDEVYGAPWLLRTGREPRIVGTLEALAEAGRHTPYPGVLEKVLLRFQGAPPAVGTSLRLFRITKTIPQVGDVATPTGVVRILTAEGDSAVALITQQYQRIQIKDMLGTLPSYSLKLGEYPQAVSRGPEAMIMGFAGTAVVKPVGSVAFLDQGSDDGVSVGDEYELVNPSLGSHPVEGRLQVVSVTADGASARIVQITGAVFRQGVAVRLSRKMR
ncbi:MAG: LysM peptidoglycan-binding domain-containing protein [Gemmatimonadetes bacterium]|nr:LysM peptidoglycan-binding domain-containing protein [Gemmatimonadota bacterium]